MGSISPRKVVCMSENRLTTTEPTISVILLTHRRPAALATALRTLELASPAPNEIIVFDDDPEGSGRQAAGLDHPVVRYVCSGQNHGPAGARNVAAREATGDILFFLDDDCLLESGDAVATLRECFRQAEIGCVACLIRNATTRDIVPKEFPGYHPECWETPQWVTYFLAGGFAIRREAYLALGGFDPRLYHGEEEIELSFRLLHAGWQIWYTPQVVVLHDVSSEGRETIRRSYRLIRNRVYLAVKHLPMPYCLSHLVLWGGFALLAALRARELGEFLRGIRSLKHDDLLAQARAYRHEHPMTRATLAYLKAHDGRLWY